MCMWETWRHPELPRVCTDYVRGTMGNLKYKYASRQTNYFPHIAAALQHILIESSISQTAEISVKCTILRPKKTVVKFDVFSTVHRSIELFN